MSFLNKIGSYFKRNEVNYQAPLSNDSIPPYQESFLQAVRFTKSCGFDEPEFLWSADEINILDQDGAFLLPTLHAASITDLSGAAGQCLKWCHYLQPYFEAHLQRQVALTVGQIWYRDKRMFNLTFEEIRRWSKVGMQTTDFTEWGGYHLHAWLTVETGEIIEPTFLSSLATVNQSYSKMHGAAAWGRDPKVLNFHRYFPMVVGNKVIEHIAKLTPIPILASSVKDLSQINVLVVPK